MEEEQVRDNEPRGFEADGERVSAEGVERLRMLVGGVRVAMMTTVEAGGALRSRPMAVQAIDDDGVAWLITQRTSPKVGEVEREHNVNLAFLRPARGRYVSVSGRAVTVQDEQKLRTLWHPTLHAWFPDGLDDPDLCLLRVQVDKAESWSAPAGNLLQMARLAGSLLGRAPRAAQAEGRDTVMIRTHQPGIGDTAGILGSAGGSMGEAPRTPRDRGGPRVAGAAGGTLGETTPPAKAARSAPVPPRASAAPPREPPSPKAPRATAEAAPHARGAGADAKPGEASDAPRRGGRSR